MSKPQVLFLGDLNESIPEFQQFKESFDVSHYKLTTLEEIKQKFAGEFSQISAIYAGWLGFVPIGGLTAELAEHLPASLKVITITSVGYDAYDIPALKKRGIQLYNTPSLGASAVADTVLWHILESFRFYKRFEHKLMTHGHVIAARAALQTKDFNSQTGELGTAKDDWLANAFAFGEIAGGQAVRSPVGKVCGIVGLGRIGKEVAIRAEAIGMKVAYHKRSEDPNVLFKYYPNVNDMCRDVDCLVICCPGNAETKNLVGKEQLDLMKTDAKVINVGRGFVIDEDHTIKKLQNGTLGWLGLDVYTGEPIVDKRLLGRWDVSLTPHMASSTLENFDATAKYALANIHAALKGGEGQSRVC